MTSNGNEKIAYGDAIREAFEFSLAMDERVFAIGQGLWSPWYVGNSMRDLDKKFGKHRVIDTPVSELACTGAAVGASLFGYRPVAVHPRMDFMLLAVDQIVNQAAKWSYMLGGQASPAVTIRSIINRGGEQGAQHSQALHSWFAHIPGLRVVMPATALDARDLLIASIFCNDPVLYIDDRWLYEREATRTKAKIVNLAEEQPEVLREGDDVTLVGAGFSSYMCELAAEKLADAGVSCEVVDVRVLNPFKPNRIVESVHKTGRICAVDGGWRTAGMAAEYVSSVLEEVEPANWRSRPVRITLPDCPAPTSKSLEDVYYPSVNDVCSAVRRMF